MRRRYITGEGGQGEEEWVNTSLEMDVGLRFLKRMNRRMWGLKILRF